MQSKKLVIILTLGMAIRAIITVFQLPETAATWRLNSAIAGAFIFTLMFAIALVSPNGGGPKPDLNGAVVPVEPANGVRGYLR